MISQKIWGEMLRSKALTEARIGIQSTIGGPWAIQEKPHDI